MSNSDTNRGKPAVSIIMPVYNAGKELESTLIALLSQSLDSLEIICIDDGSDNESPIILDSYALEFPNVLHVIHTSNQGAYLARHRGLQEASGKYIGFCDAGDIPHSTMYLELYKALTTSKADMAVCPYQRITNKHHSSTEMNHFSPRLHTINEEALWLIAINTAQWNKLIRKDKIDCTYTLKSTPKVGEDALFMLSLYPHIKSVYFLENALYDYNVQNNSLMTSYLSKNEVENIIFAWKQVRSYIQIHYSNFLKIYDSAALIHLGISLPLLINPIDRMDYLGQIRSQLNLSFPLYQQEWNLEKTIRGGYCNVLLKPFLASKLFESPLFAPMLDLYTFLTNKMHISIKW